MIRRAAVLLVVLAFLGVFAQPAAADLVKITSFSPLSGPPGTIVTINGGGLGTTTKVQFNGVNATFVVHTARKVTAVVPPTASSGPITVTKAKPVSSATSVNDFTVTLPPDTTPWPMFQHDPQHTGKSTGSGPSTSAVRANWEFKGPSWIKNEPSIGPDGTVYIGLARHPLCALEGASGTQKWCTNIGGFVNQSSATIGNPFMKTDAQGTRKVQTVYMGDRNNVFWAVDSEGDDLWSYKINLDGDVRASAIIGPEPTNTIYMMCGCTTRAVMHALAPDGTLKWFLNLPTSRDASPAAIQFGPHFRLYMVSNNAELVAIDDLGTSGVVAWTLPLATLSEHSSPTIGPDGTIYVGTEDGLFAVRDNGTSAQVLPGWPFPTAGGVDTTAAISSGKVYVSSLDGGTRTVYGINPATNPPTQLWSKTGPGSGSTSFAQTPSPVIGSNGLVYAAIGKQVYAFDPAVANPAATPRWQFTLRDDAIALTVGDGVLYVSAKDSRVYALIAGP